MEHFKFKPSSKQKAICRFFVLFLYSIFFSCTNKDIEPAERYNKKANEVIAQVLAESQCDCLIKIPSESLIEITNAERPSFNIRDVVQKKLGLKSNAQLDSLVNLSREFQLDSLALKKKGIKIITLESIMATKAGKDYTLLKTCPKGIISIQKPIFDRDFKKAVIDHSFAFTCIGGLIGTYEFKNNKWNRIENKLSQDPEALEE